MYMTRTCGLNPCFSGTYSQRNNNKRIKRVRPVLILVLVEHTLRVVVGSSIVSLKNGLNPCFSGTYSQREHGRLFITEVTSLNPCFSGTYSQRRLNSLKLKCTSVLILVLVEHTLRAIGKNS